MVKFVQGSKKFHIFSHLTTAKPEFLRFQNSSTLLRQYFRWNHQGTCFTAKVYSKSEAETHLTPCPIHLLCWVYALYLTYAL